MRLFFLLVILILSTNAYAKNPSDEEIKAWLNQDRITVENVQMVYLLGNERAYLADIRFDSNDSVIKKALALTRPDLDEAEFILPFPPDYIITDLDHNGVSEIIFTEKQSSEEHNLVKRSIVQLHDYKRFELFSTAYTEQKRCTLCLIEDIQWGFEDVNTDKIKDLVQDYELTVQRNDLQHDVIKKVQNIPFEKQSFKTPRHKPFLSMSSIKTGIGVIDTEMIGSGQDFNLSNKEIYCMLDFTDVKTEERITYHWVHEKLGLVTKIRQSIHPDLHYRTWMYKSLKDDIRYIGNWVVIITDEKESVLGSKEFTVHEDIILPPQDSNTSDQNTTSGIAL